MFTNNDDYDLLVANLKLEVRSILSLEDQAADEISFAVEIKNKCRDVELQPAQWSTNLIKFDFRNTENFIDFTRATFADDPSCDDSGITYSLLDSSGAPFNPDWHSIFDLEPPQVRIRSPQGQYFLAIQAQSTFGQATSGLIEVIVADFCLETAFFAEIMSIEMSLTVLGPSVTENFDKPKTDLEVMMKIPGICGAIRYELIKKQGPNSNLTPTLNQSRLTITAQSTEQSEIGLYDYTLRS